MCGWLLFFFFKQKTAYEMRISDWSSDVCSSDLPSLAAGQPATLLGYPVVEAEDMPDVAANSLSVAFGNFRQGYLIAERTETQILRDPFTHKPFVHFYASKRVGGTVSNSERSVEHTSELQSLMRISDAGFFLKKKK